MAVKSVRKLRIIIEWRLGVTENVISNVFWNVVKNSLNLHLFMIMASKRKSDGVNVVASTW